MERVDVAVIGAGPAGCAAAITLARGGARVVMVEHPAVTPPRGEVLPPEVAVPLRRLGVWERFRNLDRVPSPGLLVAWGDPRPYHNDFVFNPYGGGWQLDRAQFDGCLVAAAVQAGVTVRRARRVGSQRRKPGGWWFTGIGDGDEFFSTQADFALDATGRPARWARRLAGRRMVADRLVGIVAIVRSSATGEPDRRPLIESCPDGWWYSARIDDRRHVAAFLTDAELVSRSGLRPRDVWQARLGSAPLTRNRISTLGSAEAAVGVTSAATSRLPRICGKDWAAIGDAAATVDPLSGRGVERALGGGIAAAQALTSGQRSRALARYASDTITLFGDDQGQQRHLYQRETRWADSPFWRHRHHPSRPIEEQP